MKKVLLAVVFLLLLSRTTYPTLGSGDLLFVGDFETGDLTGFYWLEGGNESNKPLPSLLQSPWQSLGPGGGGSFDVFGFSPGYVYVGTDIGGIYRSPDHGQTWESANKGIYDYLINDIAVDPSRPATLYVATAGGVYKTENSGAEWHLLTNGFPEKEADRYSAEIGTVAVDPSNPDNVYAGVADVHGQVVAVGNGDIYKSTDGGASWHKYNVGSSNAAVYKVVVDPKDSNYVYAAASGGFFRSTNGGQNWIRIDDLQSRGLVAGFDEVDQKTILYRTVWSTGVYKSDDRGLSWKKVTDPDCPAGCHYYRIVMDPSDPRVRTVYIGDFGDWRQDRGVFVTTDGGESWTRLNSFGDKGWKAQSVSLRVRALGLNPYDPSELFCALPMSIFRRYGDSDWEQVYTTQKDPGGGISTGWPGKWKGRGSIDNTQVNTKPMFHPTNHDEYLLGYSDLYIWKTSDDGEAWENIQKPGDNDIRSLVADPNDETFQTWFAGDSAQQCCDGALYKTTDGGRSWNKASGLPNDRVWGIAISPDNPNYVYVSTQNYGVYRSTDGGMSFSARNGSGANSLPLGRMYHIVIDKNNPHILYVPVDGSGGGIYKTTDGGGNWAEVGAFSSCTAIETSLLDSSIVYAGCSRELFKSEDGGNFWVKLFEEWEHPAHPAEVWEGAHIRDIALHPVDPDSLCFVVKDDPYHDQSSGGGLFCANDGGHTWKEIAEDLGLLLRGVRVAFHPLPDPQTGEYDLFYMTGGAGVSAYEAVAPTPNLTFDLAYFPFVQKKIL